LSDDADISDCEDIADQEAIVISDSEARCKPRSKLSSDERSRIWQKHLEAPKVTQIKLAEWAKGEFQLEKLTQATISAILKEFRSSSSGGGNLTNQQVQMIVKKSKQTKMSQTKLATWAKRQFSLDKAPCQATISNILNNKRGLASSLDDKDRGIKRRRVVKSPELDNILLEWILQRQENRVALSWQLIQRKAEDFSDRLNLSPEQRPTFSDGWLEKFLDRHGLKTIVLSGESGSADVAAIEAALPDIQSEIQGYSPKDVFNMDETGLFYCLSPDRTIATRQLEGLKKDKTRISIALCANADGSEKQELFFIGHAAKPRAFNKKTGQQLGFYYRHNKKAWMTSLLFQEWLLQFDAHMKRQQRNVLLILDNAPTHMVKNLTLVSVKVLFLPPNTTSRIQPMDAGIIAAFKKRYRSFHLANAIDRDAAGEKDLYKVDILKAMRWCRSAWNALAPSTIENCWRHTGLMSAAKQPTNVQLTAEREIEDQLIQQIKELKLSSPLSVEDMAEREAEADTHFQFSDSDLVELFTEPAEQVSDADDDVIVLERNVERVSIDAKIKAVKLTLDLLLDDPIENEAAIRPVRKVLYRLSSEKAAQHSNDLMQSDIRAFMAK
jgi:hypothetical protein